MGQCMSRKAAGALAASAAVSQNRPKKMQKHQKLISPEDEDTISTKPRGAPLSAGQNNQKNASYLSKGVAMSFGFKRRTAPSIAANSTAARRLANANVDGNGNDDDESSVLTDEAVPTGRTTPRLAPPKKEASATRVSRFGFRQTQANRQNKVADLNYPPADFCSQNVQNANNNLIRKPVPVNRTAADGTGNDNINKHRTERSAGTQHHQPQSGKFTFQSTQLPRPEPVRVIETKTAKTLANNNRKVARMYQHPEETSSKDGSLTEDSGVGSHLSGFTGENELMPGLEQLDASPTFGVRRRIGQQKPRNLEVVVTSSKTFDVRDLNDSCDSIPPPPLPELPSAFHTVAEKKRSYHPTGLVRERTFEYQRHLNFDNRGRKISITSSEGFSDDYGEEEKTCKDLLRRETAFVKSTPPPNQFLKSNSNRRKKESTPPSSDEHEWAHGGEAMADEISFSFSSSDESREKDQNNAVPVSTAVIGSALQSLTSVSLAKIFTSNIPNEIKSVMLTIEDPKFAAVAAASNSGILLDDETLVSPVDSISCSETEESRRKLQRSCSDPKGLNEKSTPPSPGTPTNASNSLSLSDGKDDFLIDDEIADQPALVFEDRIVAPNDNSISQNTNSETTPTIVDSTPKHPRRPQAFEGSPLSMRSKRFLRSRTGSLDTLSPCESIASDDLMMDYEYSQSSGLDECDTRQSSCFPSLNDALKTEHSESSKKIWSNVSHGNFFSAEKPAISHAPRPRLLRSRAGTPSSISDSPRSLDSRASRICRPATNTSPAKPRLGHLTSNGYDSDDSIRLDRANHTAVKQDIMSIKAMLLKLRRVLNETETHNPFGSQAILTNGIFNGLCPSDFDNDPAEESAEKARSELAEMRKQVLFLHGQLEDKERTVLSLQEQMIKLTNDNYHANSAPASTTASPDSQMCNAATQTERCD